MTWIVITASLVYCFTVALTVRYKEQALEEREKTLKHYQDHQNDLAALFAELEEKDRRIDELEKQFC
jgi:biopolymer transport protein ExbB/TolQ